MSTNSTTFASFLYPSLTKQTEDGPISRRIKGSSQVADDSLGSNRAAAEAAMEGELPRIFALESQKLGTPIGAAVLMGIVSTSMLVLYGLMAGTNEDLFWSLFSFSAVIFLLPYHGMLLAFVKMRLVDANHPRPYRVPGGLGTARVLAWCCLAVLALSLVLFVYTPGEGMQWPVLAGVVITLALGEFVIHFAENHRRR